MEKPIINISETLIGPQNPVTKTVEQANAGLSIMFQNKYSMLINSGLLRVAKPLIYKGGFKALEPVNIEYPEQQGEEVSLFQANNGNVIYTRFGSPVFCNTILRTQDEQYWINLDTSIINIDYRKIIVKTQVAGRNGTFKEYISDDDYMINISGVLVNDNMNSYPSGDMINFTKIIKKNEQLTVLNPILEILGVSSLVIESVRYPQRPGFENMQAFEIMALSDTDYEIEYLEQK